MKLAQSIVAALAVVTALGCGGSSSDKQGGQGDASAGSSGVAGQNGRTCYRPACLSNLMDPCTPSGDCVEQTTTGSDPAITETNTCFANGVKYLKKVTNSEASASWVYTIKKGNSVCYTTEMQVPRTTGETTTATLRDASGAVIAINSVSVSNGRAITTVTCTGQAPVVVDPTCGENDSPVCKQGRCIP